MLQRDESVHQRLCLGAGTDVGRYALHACSACMFCMHDMTSDSSNAVSNVMSQHADRL